MLFVTSVAEDPSGATVLLNGINPNLLYFCTNRMLIISSRAIIPSRSINRSTMDNTISSGREFKKLIIIIINY